MGCWGWPSHPLLSTIIPHGWRTHPQRLLFPRPRPSCRRVHHDPPSICQNMEHARRFCNPWPKTETIAGAVDASSSRSVIADRSFLKPGESPALAGAGFVQLRCSEDFSAINLEISASSPRASASLIACCKRRAASREWAWAVFSRSWRARASSTGGSCDVVALATSWWMTGSSL